MTFKKIHFIINPASGAQEPILSFINNAFKETDIDWEVFVTKKGNDATNFASHCINHADLIAVYGGDGSIAEVAKVLVGKEIPLAIIPGGTANVISKELLIPQLAVDAIEVLKSGKFEFKNMDVGILNEHPFLIRANFGIMAEMILEASRTLKNQIGQLAYGITALKSLANSVPIKYKMMIDGKEIMEEGVALTVTNCGNIGIGNYSFLPDISVTDGMLDVILLKNSNIASLLRIAGTTLFQSGSEVLMHWKCKEIKISLAGQEKIILDDEEMQDNNFNISLLNQTLKVVVPLSNTIK